MTEALTLQLAQVEGLHVISRTSVMRYKDEPKSIPVVAQELAVDFVVEARWFVPTTASGSRHS